jgi:hypothetical protein
VKIAIFTPTQRPGIDITAFSIARQKTDHEIFWIVCDELFAERAHVFQSVVKPIVNCETKHFYITKKEGNPRNLARSYNTAIDYARDWDADLFISLQDYIWVPEDGVEKFATMARKVDQENDFRAIYTGITSITADPEDDQIHDLNGLFTIFKQPYDQRPQEIEWMDVRYRVPDSADFHFVPEIEYETNWAALPHSALYDDRLYFDEEYDAGVAYENQDYAMRAQHAGYKLLIDMNNQVLSLPHKRYFSEEWAREQPLTEVNRKLTEDRWS